VGEQGIVSLVTFFIHLFARLELTRGFALVLQCSMCVVYFNSLRLSVELMLFILLGMVSTS
jgi:hypothetical protein